jgi:cytochrome c
MQKISAVVVLSLLNLALPYAIVGQDHATPQEVVSKVRQAANNLSKTRDLAQFNQKEGPWVWKDTYIFVQDCDKKVSAANSIFPKDVGHDLAAVKDSTGKQLYPDPTAFCDAAKSSSGTWVEYRWPKPGEKEDSRKVSYFLGAKGTPYVVGAGIYDEKATIAELSKLSSKK